MEIRLGKVVARCPSCQGTEFIHLDPGTEFTALSDLICASCEAAATYGELILQIGDTALKSARERLRGPG